MDELHAGVTKCRAFPAIPARIVSESWTNCFKKASVPITYALLALVSGMLAYGTSVRFGAPPWTAASLTWIGANAGVGLVVLIMVARGR